MPNLVSCAAIVIIATFSMNCSSSIGGGGSDGGLTDDGGRPIGDGGGVFPDEDMDGYDNRTDCDDFNSGINPGRLDVCDDNVDNDCDGTIDGPDCATECEAASHDRSSVGCVYYPVDTSTFTTRQYAIAISNVNDAKMASVVVEVKNGGTWAPIAGGNYVLAPLSLQTVPLAHRSVSGTTLSAGGAYRVTSDLPVIAYQFTPLDGDGSFYSDASLLLPASSHDTKYIVPAWPNGQADGDNDRYPAHIQISAGSATEVTILSPIATSGGGGVPALAANVPQTISMTEGDLLQLTSASFDTSFNGTVIEATAPVGVFTSNDCVNVPLAACCCEHLEEQVFGLQTWGNNYVASRVPVRAAEPALWQVMAQEDNTNVAFTFPAGVTGLPATVTLGKRQMVEYTVNGPANAPGDFLVSSDKPVLLTQYMVAQQLAGNGQGDPSMVQAVPVEQYLSRYVVLIPTTWRNDFLVVTRKSGTDVSVDDVPVTAGWLDVAGDFQVARIPAADGVHKIEGSEPVGVIVVGYDEFDSYAYPGGLNQQLINPTGDIIID